MPPRRILFITPPVGPIGSGEAGGVETHLLGLAPLLIERGHHIGIVAPAGSVVPIAGVDVYQIPGPASPSATRADRSAVYAARTGGLLENMWKRALHLQSQYDLVIGVSYDWLPFHLTPSFQTPIAHWITICSAIDEVDRIIEQRWREGGLHLALYTAAQTRTFPFLQPERVHLLYGGVDTAVFQFNAEPRDRLCWAARISPEKGLEDAVVAARALQLPLDVCGKIQDPAYWRSILQNADGAEIVYHGFLSPPELQQRYAAARAALVTPRWTEAFGNTVVEALACGTPVVAYAAGGPAEIIEHRKSGMLVAPSEGIAGLIEGVREAGHIDRRAARARAEEFTYRRMADRFESWITAILTS